MKANHKIMSSRKILSKNPIVEALLDIKVVLPNDANIYSFESVFNDIKQDFPVKQITTKQQTKITLEAEKAPSVITKGEPNGFFFKSADGNRIFQARPDGFTFNCIKDYKDWESFSSEAFRMWEIYSKTIKPIKINRIGLRYINKIKIPLPIKEFKEYILIYPEVTSTLPQALEGFFLRFVISNDDGDVHAIVTLTIDLSASDEKNVVLIFDIDAYCQDEHRLSKISNINELIPNIKEFVNKIFFESLTDKAISLLN